MVDISEQNKDGRETMYATSADWTFDTQPNFESQSEDYISKIKDAGAIHWFYVLTSDNTARSMTIWPDAKTAHGALSMVRDDAARENNQTISGVCEGVVLNGF